MLSLLPEELVVMVCSWIPASIKEFHEDTPPEIKTISSLILTCSTFSYLKNYHYLFYSPDSHDGELTDCFSIGFFRDGIFSINEYMYYVKDKQFYGYWSMDSQFSCKKLIIVNGDKLAPRNAQMGTLGVNFDEERQAPRNVFQTSMTKQNIESYTTRTFDYYIDDYQFFKFDLWNEKRKELMKMMNTELLQHIQQCDMTQQHQRILIWKSPFPKIQAPKEWIEEIKQRLLDYYSNMDYVD